MTSFNPRPGHATGATHAVERIAIRLAGFNPRPGHATGATADGDASVCGDGVSIRAPVTRPGRLRMHQRKRPLSVVSIRAPVTRPGRRLRDATMEVKISFQSAPRSRDRGDCDLPNWRSRKSFVAHFRKPANFSRTKTYCDVKERWKLYAAIGFAHWRETPASKPSLMVRGSVVIKLAARPNQLACPCHDVQSSVWRFH